MAGIGAFDRWFIAANKWLLIALMATMTALVFANVVARYLLGFSIGWAEELSRFAMIWIAFLGVGLALRHGQLVAVEVLQAALPRPAARAVRLLAVFLVAGFLLALLLLGIAFVEFSLNNRTPVLRISRAWPYLAVPLGAAFALLHLALGFLAVMRSEFLELADLEREAGEPDNARRPGAETP